MNNKEFTEFTTKLFAYLDEKFSQIDQRFDKIELRLAQLEIDVHNLYRQLQAHMEEFVIINHRLEQIEVRLARIDKWIGKVSSKLGVSYNAPAIG